MRSPLHFLAVVAALQLLASAAPAASSSSIDTDTLYIVYTHGTSFTFPNLVPGTISSSRITQQSADIESQPAQLTWRSTAREISQKSRIFQPFSRSGRRRMEVMILRCRWLRRWWFMICRFGLEGDWEGGGGGEAAMKGQLM